MPQFRVRPDARRLTPEESDARTFSVLAAGLESTQVGPGQAAEITASVRISVRHEENGAPKDRRLYRRHASGELVSRLLVCHADRDYEEALFEFEQSLTKHYIPGCELLFVDEFSIQPVS